MSPRITFIARSAFSPSPASSTITIPRPLPASRGQALSCSARRSDRAGAHFQSSRSLIQEPARTSASGPPRLSTGAAMKVGSGSTSAVRQWPRERQLTVQLRHCRVLRKRSLRDPICRPSLRASPAGGGIGSDNKVGERSSNAGRPAIEVWVFLRRRTQKPWEANPNPYYSQVDERCEHEPRTIRFHGIKQTGYHRNE